MKNLFKNIGAVLLLLMASGLSFSDDQMTLHILGDDKAKPKNWLNESGQPEGIMIDLLAEVTRRTGITFTYELAPWNRSFRLSSLGDGAIIGFSKTAKRELKWDYSVPMYFDELSIVTTQDKVFEFKNLKSLSGKRLAIKLGASYGDDFEAAKASGLFTTVETVDRAGQMRMLTLDRVDALLLSPGKIALESIISENEWLSKHRDTFVILNPPYKKDPNYLGIPKAMKKSHLLPLINEALNEIQQEDIYLEIVNRNTDKVLQEIRRE